MHVKVQIGDEHGLELPRNHIGEIQVRGPVVKPGYWHDPEATDVIDDVDAVSQCAVIGAPDRKRGEVGVALVVLRPCQPLEPDRILEHCRERLARYKVPPVVRIVPALPLSPQGKILKRELYRLYVESGGQQPSKVA